MLQAQADFVADGLHLFLVGAGADDEVVGERGDAGEVEHDQVGGFFRFRSADGNQPGWRSGLGGSGFLEIGLGQNRLLPLSYYGLRGKFTAETLRKRKAKHLELAEVAESTEKYWLLFSLRPLRLCGRFLWRYQE
jgi:hypothetical protein